MVTLSLIEDELLELGFGLLHPNKEKVRIVNKDKIILFFIVTPFKFTFMLLFTA